MIYTDAVRNRERVGSNHKDSNVILPSLTTTGTASSNQSSTIVRLDVKLDGVNRSRTNSIDPRTARPALELVHSEIPNIVSNASSASNIDVGEHGVAVNVDDGEKDEK